jgi:hypothetical protein
MKTARIKFIIALVYRSWPAKVGKDTWEDYEAATDAARKKLRHRRELLVSDCLNFAMYHCVDPGAEPERITLSVLKPELKRFADESSLHPEIAELLVYIRKYEAARRRKSAALTKRTAESGIGPT